LSANLSQLIPEFEPYARDLVTLVGQAGLQPRVTSTRRSYAEQKRLYSRYLAGGAAYPAAPPGHSAHEYGYAFDMVVSPLDALPVVGNVWRQAGGVWHPSDSIHFEYPGFQSPRWSEEEIFNTALSFLSPWKAGLASSFVDVAAYIPKQFLTGAEWIPELEVDWSRFKNRHWTDAADTRVVEGAIPDGWIGVDIGPKTIERYRKEIGKAKTVVWNGPLGKYEDKPFSQGTRSIAEALSAAQAVTVVGGGETAEAVEALRLAENMTHVSTGGGAFLEYMEGTPLPALAQIDERKSP